MSPGKRFFYIFTGVYVVGAILGSALWGPPGLSKAYLAEYGHEHEHYLEIVKSQEYKLHRENPRAHPLDEHWMELAAFVEDYEAKEEFEAEQGRRHRYSLYFDFYNAAAVVILAVYYGRKPLLDFLDARVAEIRQRIADARADRERAAASKAAAEERLKGLDKERLALLNSGRESAEAAAAEIDAGTQEILEFIDKETEDRICLEEIRAKMRIKLELVDESVRLTEKHFRDMPAPERQRMLVQQFVSSLEKRP